jgi:aldehyde dehydrogenase (NAD+)
MAELKKYQTYIGGAWCDAMSGETFESEDPYTGEPWALIPSCGEADVNKAVEAAYAAWDGGPWSEMTATARGRMMRKLGDLIAENAESLANAEVRDNGKLISEMLAQCQYLPEWYYYYGGLADKITGSVIATDKPDTFNYTLREPVGVCAMIVPWNSPLLLVAWKLAPALAAGCTAVIKPSEFTSASLLEFMKLVEEAGFPPGVVNVVTGTGKETGEPLVTHPRVAKVAFTGGGLSGRRVYELAAQGLKKVSLELGGKSPVVVFPDADLEQVIPGACRAAFFLQGQNCMAGTRLFVHDDVYEQVVTGVAAMASSFKIGPGMDPATELGPLISANQRETVMRYIESGKAAGAELVCGGEALPGKGFFVQPTLFGNTNMDMQIAREEIFGPVLCVQRFSDSTDLAGIAAECNKTVYGLSGSVWTRDISVAHKMAQLIDSGQVSINCHAAVDPAIPFGGNRQSGWGREFGEEGLEPFLKTKATTVLY